MIKIFFGAPGCGKSTATAYFAYKNRQRTLKRALRGKPFDYNYIFCNSDVEGTTYFTKNLLDTMAFPKGSLVLIDEAGIDFNSRKTLSMSDGMQRYLKKHRHFDNDIYLFSQSWEDIDIVFSRLACEVWHMKKIGPFTLCRRILKDADVNPDTNKIEDMYKKEKLYKKFLPPPFGSFSFFLIYRPKYYRYFDSWEKEERPLIKGIPIVGE